MLSELKKGWESVTAAEMRGWVRCHREGSSVILNHQLFRSHSSSELLCCCCRSCLYMHWPDVSDSKLWEWGCDRLTSSSHSESLHDHSEPSHWDVSPPSTLWYTEHCCLQATWSPSLLSLMSVRSACCLQVTWALSDSSDLTVRMSNRASVANLSDVWEMESTADLSLSTQLINETLHAEWHFTESAAVKARSSQSAESASLKAGSSEHATNQEDSGSDYSWLLNHEKKDSDNSETYMSCSHSASVHWSAAAALLFTEKCSIMTVTSPPAEGRLAFLDWLRAVMMTWAPQLSLSDDRSESSVNESGWHDFSLPQNEEVTLTVTNAEQQTKAAQNHVIFTVHEACQTFCSCSTSDCFPSSLRPVWVTQSLTEIHAAHETYITLRPMQFQLS